MCTAVVLCTMVRYCFNVKESIEKFHKFPIIGYLVMTPFVDFKGIKKQLIYNSYITEAILPIR